MAIALLMINFSEKGGGDSSVGRATPDDEFPAVAARSLLAGSVSV